MGIDLRFISEIVDFLSVETLEKIDYGVLDLSKIKDYELKETLYYYGELLEAELRYDYLKSTTGLFRVSAGNGKFYYCEFDIALEAESIAELKDLVLSQNRIWYAFDEVKAREVMRKH